MNCGGCAKAVTRALHAVDAEAKVEVDLKGGIVAVTGTPGIGAERSSMPSAPPDTGPSPCLSQLEGARPKPYGGSIIHLAGSTVPPLSD